MRKVSVARCSNAKPFRSVPAAFLSALGPIALALAIQLGQFGVATAAGYSKTCERPTGKSTAGCLGAPISVPDPATDSVRVLRPILFFTGDDLSAARRMGSQGNEYQHGVADANGRTLVIPRYRTFDLLSATTAVASLLTPQSSTYASNDNLVVVDLATDTATALPFPKLARYRRNGFAVVFGVAAKHPEGREDWRHIRMDGTLGRMLEGVVHTQRPSEYAARSNGLQTGPFIIVNQSPNGDGKVYSNWMDVTGATVFTGLAVAKHAGRLMIRVGDTPLAFDANDKGAYVPVDDQGRPSLPDNILAVAPAVQGWGLIMKTGEYRWNQGTLDAVLADPSKAVPLEEMAWLKSTTRELDGTQRDERLLVIKPVGRGWVIAGNDGIEHPTQFATAADAANSRTVARNVVVQGRQNQALAASAATARTKAQAKADFASGRDTSRSNAKIAGDDESAIYLRRAGISFYGLGTDSTDVHEWCAVGPKACAVAQAQLQAKQNERMAQAAERSAVDAAFKAFAAPRGTSDVRVQIYEGGRVRTEVWSKDHFDRMTAK